MAAKRGWQSREPMPTTRHDVGCFVVDDELLVISGFDGDTNYKTTESYGIGENSWGRRRSEIPLERGLFGTLRREGDVFVIGGKRLRSGFVETGEGPQYDVFDAVHRYRPSTDDWTRLPSLAAPRAGLGAAESRGRIYAVGGSICTDPASFPGPDDVTDLVEVYDPDSDAWTEGPPLPEPRTSPVVESVGDRVYVVGGSAEGEPRSEVFALDADAGAWTTVGSLDVPRRDAASAVSDGGIYLFGGVGEDETYLRSVVRYDPVADERASRPDLPRGKAWAGAAIGGGRAFVVGGARRVPDSSNFEFFDELHALDLSSR